MQGATETPGAGSGRAGHELRDVQYPVVTMILAVVTVLTLLGLGASWLFVKVMDRQREAALVPPSPLARTLPQQPPEPRLQANPAQDMRQFRAAEEELLNRYELIDEKGGIARIPIERAMELIAERGLPVRAESGSADAGKAAKKQ